MFRRMPRAAALIGLCLALPPAARAGGDHDRARHAVEAGEALPLADILDRVRGRLPGDIVEVELEREQGRWVYEFKVVDAGGRRIEVYVDARSAEILAAKPDGRHGPRGH